MRTSTVVLALVATIAASPARAQWTKTANATNAGDYLAASDSITDLQFVTGGMRLDQSSGFPLPSSVFYRTQDGGQLVQQIAVGGAGGLGQAPVKALAFASLTDGWVAMGGDVYRTTNGGTFTKVAVDADATISAMARLDATTGVAVGSGGGAWRTTDGGASWTAVPTGVQADLDCVQFIDARTGWAAGATPVTVSGEMGASDTTQYDENVVLATTDGGASWDVVQRFAKDETADGAGGRTSCPIFFVPDGKTGWLVQATWDVDKQRNRDLKLLRTADGGKTWRDLKVDVKVGVTKMLSWEIPMNMSYAVGMYWTADGRHGRVSGSADTGMSTSGGGGGGDQPVYKLVDLVTQDGGTTWTKPDYGQITMDISGGGTGPTGDPRPLSASFGSWYQAVMVGEKGTIWRMGSDCAKTSECIDGYECTKPDPKIHAKCTPIAGGPADPEVIGDRDAVTGADGSGEGTSPKLDIPACEGDDCPKGGSGGGCAGGPIPGDPGAWPAAILMVALWVAARRSRG